MNMRGVKLSNEYAGLLGPLYSEMPKAVLAAVAVSFAHRINEGVFHGVASLVVDEWRALYDNSIVQQKPPKDAVPEPSEEERRIKRLSQRESE